MDAMSSLALTLLYLLAAVLGVVICRSLALPPMLGYLGADAAALMEQHGITSILVMDEQDKLLGLVHIRDLMRAKVI